MFSGRFSVRCSAASGLHKGQHVCCCVRIGLLSQQTKVVTVDGDGIATWDEALVFDLDADPSLMATIQHVEDDDVVASAADLAQALEDGRRVVEQVAEDHHHAPLAELARELVQHGANAGLLFPRLSLLE